MATWTTEEDKILIESYEKAPREEILSKLPGRIWQSCYKRSVILGLKRPTDNAWTEKEDIICRNFYPNTPQDELLLMLPGRTWKAVTWHAINILHIIRSKEITQAAARKTNQAKLGVDYPSQSAKVKESIKKVVQEKYGVDNVFQAEEVKKQIRLTNLINLGVENPQQCKATQEKTSATMLERHGVDNALKLTARVRDGMREKYGYDHPQRVPEIRERTEQTNLGRYGTKTPSENEDVKKKLIEILNTPEIREKKYETYKKNGTFTKSIEEENFYAHLKNVDLEAQHHVLHPEFKYMIDFYLPKHNLWVQYDGIYWHGKIQKESQIQSENIKEGMKRDAHQNELISNLIRFWSDDVLESIKNNTVDILIKDTIEDKLDELKNRPPVCHQYKKKIQFYNEDINNLPFNTDTLKASDFVLNVENMSEEIATFIERYEWLGTIGVPPKWCFTARYNGFLGGVVLINEPTSYSTILGNETPKYEALIQRGASASWSPKNLGSRLIMFSCKWMVNNTGKRAFVGYADINAHEKGIIYRACNFDYLGNDFGAGTLYKHPLINRSFTKQFLFRTSTFKVWCRDNKINTEKTWFKDNGFKNLETLPSEIKAAWYTWNKKIISEAERIKLNKKMKYAIILGKNKKETKLLRKLRTYDIKNYPKDIEVKNNGVEIKIVTGKTRKRGNSAKDQFLIENYGKITKNELAKKLGETPRWVKRALAKLSKQNKITLIRKKN